MSPTKSIVWFLIFWFCIVLFTFVLTGTFSTDGKPLQIVQDISTSIGTTVWAIGIGFFVIGTFLDLMMMFFNIARGW